MRLPAAVVTTCGAVFLAAADPSGSPPSPRFSDVTGASGIDVRNLCGSPPDRKGWLPETLGAGAAWLDHDNDGHLDLYVVNGSSYDRKPGAGEPNRMFRGNGRGRFTDVTAASGTGDRGWGYGVAVGDADNDGDADIYVTNMGPNVFYENDGKGRYRDVTARTGTGHPGWGASAAFFDMEGDGDLDLYVTNYVDFDPATIPRAGSAEAVRLTCTYRGIPVVCGPLGLPPAQDVLYRNDGDGTFTDVTRVSGVRLETPRYGLGVVTGDIDGDGDADIYVANDSVRNSLWRNRGDGTFEDIGVASLTALNHEGSPQAGMGTDLGDFDGDGRLDIVVTNFSHDLNTVYRNAGRFFTDRSFAAGMGPTYMALSWGTAFRDLDNDGDLDLFIANGHVYPEVDRYGIGTRFRQANHLFVNEGGRFVDVSMRAGPALAVVRSFRGAAFGDYDADGDVDIFLTALDEQPLLLRNDTPRQGHSLCVRLVGSRSNRDGIGSRLTLTAGGRTQVREITGGGSYLSSSECRAHFGIGSATKVDSLEIRWAGGGTETLRNLAPGRAILVREGSGVSR